MKGMVYRRIRDYRVDGSEGKVNTRCPDSESQDHETKGHGRIDFPTFFRL